MLLNTIFAQAYFSIESMFFTAESHEAMQQLNTLIFLFAIKNRDNNIRLEGTGGVRNTLT